MAQKTIDLMFQQGLYNKKTKKLKNVKIQNNENIFILNISHSKSISVFYSKPYKENVISFNLGISKKFILSRNKWFFFREYKDYIDNLILNQNDLVIKKTGTIRI